MITYIATRRKCWEYMSNCTNTDLDPQYNSVLGYLYRRFSYLVVKLIKILSCITNYKSRFTMSQTETTEVVSYKTLKSRIRDNCLSSAVGWAKAERMVEGHIKATEFDFDYMEAVHKTVVEAMMKGGEHEDMCLRELGMRSVLRGKVVTIDDKSWQPVISFEGQDYKDTEGVQITDLRIIGQWKFMTIHKKCSECYAEVEGLKLQRKLLRWKQKFFRYMYNFNDTEMIKYHDKISEFESAMFDARCEANVDGREIAVIVHKSGDCVEDDDSLLGGCRTRDRGEASSEPDDGGKMKAFADSMKTAFDVRLTGIQTIQKMLAIPVEKRKTIKIGAETKIINPVGDVPTLI